MAISATVTSRKHLPDIASASAAEMVGDLLFVAGDDSPHLGIYSQALELIGKIPLYSPESFDAGRVPKSVKPDLEASFVVFDDDIASIVMLGSGSKLHTRDVGYKVELPWDEGVQQIRNLDRAEISQCDLSKLYERLRQILGGNREDSPLNIEGATVIDGNVLLFHRGVGDHGNFVFMIEARRLNSWLADTAQPPPPVDMQPLAVPKLDDIPAGFSGAATITDQNFSAVALSASAELTASPIDDGPVAGSLFGITSLNDLLPGRNPKIEWATVTDGDQPFRGKIESVTGVRRISEAEFVCLGVTDDDRGGSEIITLRINLG